MFNKKLIFILILLFITIGAISSVSAGDLNPTDDNLTHSDNTFIKVNDNCQSNVNSDNDVIQVNGDYQSFNDFNNNFNLNYELLDNSNDSNFDDELINNLDDKSNLQSNSLEDSNVIYFDANVPYDGDGSEKNPYKYLYSNRIKSGITAYFNDGTYNLDSSCTVSNVKFIGQRSSKTIINSLVLDNYDFIVKENSYFDLDELTFNNVRILNHGNLIADTVFFDGNDIFDSENSPEIKGGSGLLNSSYGGVIICDTPSNIKTTLVLKGCFFQDICDAYIGGAIAAVNSNISIDSTSFYRCSSIYKGGSIYCLNCDLKIMQNSWFVPYSSSNDTDYAVSRYDAYTSYYGGSIYCENSNVLINRTKFIGSSSYSFGGCIALFNSSIYIYETDFNNSASLTDGGGVIYNSRSYLYIFNSVFKNNTAEFGGAICNLNGIIDSNYVQYYDNYANSYGGAIYDIYGTLNFNHNWFGYARALIGGAIYTRIPNDFNFYSNSFGDTYAKEGSAIFFDGKRENIGSGNNSINYDDLMVSLNSTGLDMFNTYSNSYSFVLEFNASLNGRNYSLLSNPIYYRTSSTNYTSHYSNWRNFEVSSDVISMVMFDNDDPDYMEVLTDNIVRNITANITFSTQFVNPTLTFYLYEHIDNGLFIGNVDGINVDPLTESIYSTSYRTKYTDPNTLVGAYNVDLSNKTLVNGNYTLNPSFSLDFSNPFLTTKYDNLYEASSFTPVTLFNYTSSILNESYSYYSNGSSSNGSHSHSTSGRVPTSAYNSNLSSSNFADDSLVSVSPVKNQKEGSNCWAFAGLATLEACLKKATGITFDFSEENAKNLMAAYSVFGLKMETNFGGYDSMLMSYLASWLGPIDESVEDYDDFSSISVLSNPMFHIQNIKFLSPRLNSSDNDLYKLAIGDNGAVAVTIRWGKDYHAVSLVGWDDNFVGYDSLGNYAHGAWIFKNSWGEDWGYNGFGYLSYEAELSEELDPLMHAYTFIFSDTNPYTKIYQYDFAGVSIFYPIDGDVYFKNKFITDNDSLLSAFSTYFDRDSNFTAMVYKNGQLVLTQEGFSTAGYYTIPFNNFIELKKGDEFTIVVKNHNDGLNSIPVCLAEEITKKTFSQNISFISYDGVNWFDLYDYADDCQVACIKAFTQNNHLEDIKINVNRFATVNTNTVNIKVDFDNWENISSINYCLVKFILDGDIHYGQIRDGKAVLNLNLKDGPHTLLIQYEDNVFISNIVQFNFTVKANSNNQSFNALQDIINNVPVKSSISLNKDYKFDQLFDDGDYGVYINKSIIINGNNHVIDGLSRSTGFFIIANNVVLNNITFRNTFSTMGGAVYVAGRNVTFNNCRFINSNASLYGGAVYSLLDININNCQFINNSAGIGGGLYVLNTKTTNIKNSKFDNNHADVDAAAVYLIGGGKTVVVSSSFTNNHANSNGGAVLSSVYNITFTKCTFTNNYAGSGGGVFSNSHINDFNNCKFSNNTAELSGGAVIAHNLINIYSSNFTKNSVINSTIDFLGGPGGGAIYSFDNLNIYSSNFINNSANSSGGAVYTSKYLNVYKSSFINNYANGSGGAINNMDWQMTRSNIGVLKFTKSCFYDSVFIDNGAKSDGGAVYYTDLINNCSFLNNYASGAGGALFDVRCINTSTFNNNSAQFGGAFYYDGGYPLYIYNSSFIKNYANGSGGAIYSNKIDYISDVNSIIHMYNSSFINNSASWGGGIYSMGIINIYDSSFRNNPVNYSGGAIYIKEDSTVNMERVDFSSNSANWGGAVYSRGFLNINNSSFATNFGNNSGGAICLAGNSSATLLKTDFNSNSASWGGAINSWAALNVSSCNFINNHVNNSGGAIYTDGKSNITKSIFVFNSAYWGGAVYSCDECNVKSSDFEVNSATWGGAICIAGSNLETLHTLHISDSNFSSNNVNRSGGAIYVEGNCSVVNSVFNYNSAHACAAIYSMYILNISKSRFKSDQKEVIYFTYYCDENNVSYGDIHIKDSTVDTKSDPAIFYNEDIKPYTSPLYLVFRNQTGTKGQYIALAHLEDTDGNSFVSWNISNLTVTLTNQNNNKKINLNCEYNRTLGAFYTKLPSLDSGTYQITGFINGNYFCNYTAKAGKLTVIKKTVLKSSALTKVYGTGNKLTFTLKDSDGKAIANTYVKIKLNGVTKSVKTNSKGQASLAVNLAPKIYTATISYAGSSIYTSASTTAKVTIKKASPKITASKKTFKIKDKTKSYTITLKNNLGKVMKNTKVTLKVNGKTYMAKTNSKGKATFKLTKLSKKGGFTATVKYAGNAYYNAVSKKVKITVK